jgi:hypothetical protein
LNALDSVESIYPKYKPQARLIRAFLSDFIPHPLSYDKAKNSWAYGKRDGKRLSREFDEEFDYTPSKKWASLADEKRQEAAEARKLKKAAEQAAAPKPAQSTPIEVEPYTPDAGQEGQEEISLSVPGPDHAALEVTGYPSWKAAYAMANGDRIAAWEKAKGLEASLEMALRENAMLASQLAAMEAALSTAKPTRKPAAGGARVSPLKPSRAAERLSA